jgi:hypothetical protein
MPLPPTAKGGEAKIPARALVLEKVRPELNLEKWSIWQPAKSKTQPRARVLERTITNATGDKVTARLKVGYTDRGPLTTEDQKTYYALVKHWEDRGMPDQYTAFSLRRISRLLKKNWGTNVIDSLTESLMRLRGTLLVWENSYYDSTTQETAELIDTFNILSDLKIIRRKIDGVVNREVGYFRFNDQTLRNLQSNHTKPVLFDVVLSFKSEIAQLIYTHVDLILAGNIFYERRTKELFEDLGITGTAYQRRPSKRKTVLEPALIELQGLPLSKGGIIASAAIERTKDQKDFKVVFRKGAATGLPTPDDERLESPEALSSVTIQPSLADQEGERLIQYFYQTFFGVDASGIRPRHRDLAASLVARYGWDLAKYIVDFSHAEAKKTNFKIATFGAVAQYVARARASYDLLSTRRKQEQVLETQNTSRNTHDKAVQNARSRAEVRYRSLPEAQQNELRESYRKQLISKDPSWGQPNAEGKYPLLDAAIRVAIINDFIRQERLEQGEETGEETISSAIAE